MDLLEPGKFITLSSELGFPGRAGAEDQASGVKIRVQSVERGKIRNSLQCRGSGPRATAPSRLDHASTRAGRGGQFALGEG